MLINEFGQSKYLVYYIRLSIFNCFMKYFRVSGVTGVSST